MSDEGIILSTIYELKDQETKLREGYSSENPIVSLVDSLLYNAIEFRASDIHLEPTVNDMRVRLRIDGVLYDQESINIASKFLVISRLKILSSLDIAERRLPQDGKFRVQLPSSKTIIDLRVATFPSIYGEKMVVRILDRSSKFIKLEELGFENSIVDKIKNFLSHQNGFFIVTGPTGSGKTTTLYSMLSSINNKTRNIVTMEDPVEYNIDGITQSQVNSKAGFSFENGLRAILRQDPDVIMIGEIRDKITLQIALQAALTGHLVLTTLHTNDAAGSIVRLLEMGVEPFLINGALNAVLAQRLVRRLCSHCKIKVKASELKNLCVTQFKTLEYLYVPKGCSECKNLGYNGRIAVGELLVMSDMIRDLLTNGASIDKIREVAKNEGMQTLEENLLNLLKSGIISPQDFSQILII